MLFQSKKNILIIFLTVLAGFSNQKIDAMSDGLKNTVLGAAAAYGLHRASGGHFLRACSGFKHLYTESEVKKIENMLDVPAEIEVWGRKQVQDLIAEDNITTMSAEKIRFKVEIHGDHMQVQETVQGPYILIADCKVAKIFNAIEHKDDRFDPEYTDGAGERNSRLAEKALNIEKWVLRHELGHVKNNDYRSDVISSIGIGLGTLTGLGGLIYLSGVGKAETMLSLFGQSAGLIAGGFLFGQLSEAFYSLGLCRQHEKLADDFASKTAKTAQELEDVANYWDQKHKEIQKVCGETDDLLVRIKHSTLDQHHPVPGDRAAAVRKVLQERFGKYATEKTS